MPHTIGIDLGGTNIEAGLIAHDLSITAHITRDTNAHEGPASVIDSLVAAIDELRTIAPPAAVGIGSPGPLSPSKGIVYRSGNLPGWENVSLRDTVARRTKLPVTIDNDGNTAAFGQYRADPTTRNLVLFTLGTGVGAGAVLEGKIFHGHHENASEWGHMIVQPGGLPCNCGQRGCLEAYASAHNLAARATTEIKAGAASSLSTPAGADQSVTAPDLVDAVRSGDAFATRLWDEACNALAVACVNVQHALNPERILFAGGLSTAGDFLLDSIQRHYDAQKWNLYNDAPELRVAPLAHTAGIIGAAALAQNI